MLKAIKRLQPALTLLILVLLSVPTIPASGQEAYVGTEDATVYVDVNAQWTGSGIMVSEGDRLIFKGDGAYSPWGADGNHWHHWIGPEGLMLEDVGDGRPLPYYPGGCLIGKIGNSAPFHVGEFTCIIAMTSGELSFGMNDYTLYDNRGTLLAFVWLPLQGTAVPSDLPGLDSGVISLQPCFPNPFNPSTAIEFALAAGGFVELGIYDITGRRTRTLLAEYREAGPHRLNWNGLSDAGAPASSGNYFVRVSANGHSRARQITLLR